MKKFLFVLLTLIFVLSLSVCAKNGDIAGNIYSTDIRANINGVWVDSYNIGGKTVVVIEDITRQFEYYDDIRTLVICDLSPEYINSSKNETYKKVGEVVGNIYETDIKVIFRGKEIESYSLNGKMAVAVEDLGLDNTFSQIGGKFIWDENNRTISLEVMYRYSYDLRKFMEDNNYNIVLDDCDTYLNAKLSAAPIVNNGYFICEKEIEKDLFVPVLYNGEIIGYRCNFTEFRGVPDENNNYVLKSVELPVDYFYEDKVKEIIVNGPKVNPTVDDWLNYYKYNTLCTVKDSFETDEYLFLYLSLAHTRGSTQQLVKLNKKDGNRILYSDSFESVSLHGQKYFDFLTIDRENEKVRFSYDTYYEIDLKTDKIEKLNK
ncbi:MAG: hypothetical protein E7391_08585 [Ruminococcaceae bacterium]|nr:hypothetical protein [Oscillospiraceae bacterium]